MHHHTGWPGHPDHYDLMLQAGGSEGAPPEVRALMTFATVSDEFPAGREACPSELRAILSHRLAYLTFEGPVSGGRGSVRRADSGDLTWLPAPEAVPGDLRFRLGGERLSGTFRLRRIGEGTHSLEREPDAV